MKKKSFYKQGIDKATREGHIDRRCEATDDFSHLDLINCCNSRFLDAATRSFLEKVRETRSKLKILELGPGAGVVASEMSLLFPQAEIYTVGLTPINPYLRFSKKVLDLAGNNHFAAATAIAQLTNSRSGTPTVEDLITKFRAGFPIFDEIKRPFIQHQTIAYFPCNLPIGKFLFIYEQFGPIQKAPLVEVAKVFRTTYELLDSDGIISIKKIGYNTENHDYATYVDTKESPVCVTIQAGTYQQFFIIKAENPLAEGIRRRCRDFKKDIIDVKELKDL